MANASSACGGPSRWQSDRNNIQVTETGFANQEPNSSFKVNIPNVFSTKYPGDFTCNYTNLERFPIIFE